MKVEAILFDAGGTLIDPVEPVGRTYFRLASEFDECLDRAAFEHEFRLAWGRLREDYRSNHPDLLTSEEMEREAWHRFTRRVAEPFDRLLQYQAEWLARLVDYFDRGSSWKKLPGVDELLALLRSNGYRLAVVSNWHGILEEILRYHGVVAQVDFVLTSSQVGRKKPHPLMFRSAIERLEVASLAAIHVGDSLEEDVVGASGAGLRPVYLQREECCLEIAPEVPVIRSILELRGVLEYLGKTKVEKNPNR